MIPRILSDDICSLREGIARPVLCGNIYADKEGQLDEAATEFFLGTIKSQGKLVYTEVSDYLENGSSPDFVPGEAVASQLKLLRSSPPAARSGALTIPSSSRTALTTTSYSTRTEPSRRSSSRPGGPPTRSSRSA